MTTNKNNFNVRRMMTGRYDMVIPEDVKYKIKNTCKNISNVEWSGVLFYTYTGTFEDYSLTIVMKDYLVLGIGTADYTEWTMDARVIAYMAENNLLDCQIGIIHSHHNMASEFSTTDIKTLVEEGASCNNFVSLIVNNLGKYTAAITRKLEIETVTSTVTKYKFFGEGYKSILNKHNSTESCVEWYMLDVLL